MNMTAAHMHFNVRMLRHKPRPGRDAKGVGGLPGGVNYSRGKLRKLSKATLPRLADGGGGGTANHLQPLVGCARPVIAVCNGHRNAPTATPLRPPAPAGTKHSDTGPGKEPEIFAG